MLLVLIGGEYSGTTTLAESVTRVLSARSDTTTVRVHDHWTAPYLTDQDPSTCYLVGPDGPVAEPERYGDLSAAKIRQLTEERSADASQLPTWVVEQMQRLIEQGIGVDLLQKAEAYLRDRGQEKAQIGYPTYVQGT